MKFFVKKMKNDRTFNNHIEDLVKFSLAVNDDFLTLAIIKEELYAERFEIRFIKAFRKLSKIEFLLTEGRLREGI